jgi:hypothetical protein
MNLWANSADQSSVKVDSFDGHVLDINGTLYLV